MLLKTIKRRLGLVYVVAGAALGTSLVNGHLLVAAVAAVVVVLALVAAMADQRGRSPRAKSQGKTAFGKPYSAVFSWKVERAPSVADTLQALSNESLTLVSQSQSPGKIVLRRGSQLWMRLLGGYFIRPKRLPIEVELRTATSTPGCLVELEVQDKCGIAVRDDALRERFALAVADIRQAVETNLEAMDDFGITEPQIKV